MAPMNMFRVVGTATVCANIYVFSNWHYNPKVDRDPNDRSGTPPPVDPVKRRKHMEFMRNNWTASLPNLREGRWWTLVTAAFSHSDLGHLAVSLWGLYQGSKIIQLIGVSAPRLVVLALGSGAAGSAGYLLDHVMGPASQRDACSLGASGMLYGMFTFSMLAAPYLPMGVPFIPKLTISLRTMVLTATGIDVACLVWEKTQGVRQKHPVFGAPIAYSAHLGGALFGAAFYLVAFRRYGAAALPRKVPMPVKTPAPLKTRVKLRKQPPSNTSQPRPRNR